MYVEFQKGAKFAGKTADISDSPDSFEDAGWILTDDDYVVDIDTVPKDIIREIIRVFKINTQTVWTDRGVHFYFKKPKDFTRGANRISPLGFPYEIKHSGNTRAVTIKRNGKMREIVNEGFRTEPPFVFNSNKKYDELLGMEEGEGRNNALFALRGRLLGVKEWQNIIRFVNDHIFATPLEDREIEILTRNMEINAEKGEEYMVAGFLIEQLDFLQFGSRYYYREDPKDSSSYTDDEDDLKRLVYEKVGDHKTFYVDEVIRQMKYRCKKIPEDTVFPIKFKNGFLIDGKFVELITDDFSPYYIDIDYDPEAKPVEIVDEYVDNLTGGEEEYRKLLIEVLGHCLITNPEFKRLLAKFFVFVGDGGNGKGTLLQIIRQILNKDNTSSLSIKDLSDERYLTLYYGKLANLGDDIQDSAIDDKDMKMLKNLSTCDFIPSRKLYKQAVNTMFTGSLIFTSNHILKSFEKGKSYQRRILWLPMYTQVTKKDPKFITKLTTDESLQYWVRLMVEGYFRLYQNAGFTESPRVVEFNKVYHEDNDPYIMFLEDFTDEELIGRRVVEFSAMCEDWCEMNDITFNKRMMYEALRTTRKISNTGRIRENGIQVRVLDYMK